MKSSTRKINDSGWNGVYNVSPDVSGYYFTCAEMDKVPKCLGVHYFDFVEQMWFEDESDVPIYPSDLPFNYWMKVPGFDE